MRDFPPTNERRSQGLLTHLRTVTTRALGGSTAKKYAPHTPPETHPVQNSPRAAGPGAHPVQNSPRTPTPAAQPVQNSPNTPKIAHFSPFCPSRENFVPHQQPNRYKTLPAQPVQALTRYKTLPTRPRQQPNRYKTLPTRPKRPISASFARAGRTLYRIHPHDPQQGELCTALTITMPSRENFVPHPEPNPVQNSPCSAGPSAQPVQNSPNTPKKAHFSQFCTSRENFVPHPPPRPPAGRTLYRSHHHDAQQGELCTAPRAKPGTKLSQHAHTSSPPGTKLSPHAPKGPFPRVLAEQGELYTASTPTTPSRENFVPHPEPNPVQNSPNTPTPAAQPVQNSPSTPTPAAQPVQNSPNTYKKAHFHAF